MNPASSPSQTPRSTAVLHAVTAHAIWGAMPLYLLLVARVPAVEFVAWRTLFTLPVCLFFVWQTDSLGELRQALRNARVVLTLLATALLLAINWLVYVWAIQNTYVYAASLGYYILPLVMMAIGVVVLKERLSARRWAAVALAGVGVAALATGALTTLWVSLMLGVSFAIYGLLRKTVAAGPLVGLTIESVILFPIVTGYLAWVASAGGGTAFGRDALETGAILAGGVITAVPLLLFASAARALPYTLIGILQFIAPTIVFVLGLTVFGEALKPAQLACFIAIWLAVALFIWDIWASSREPKVAHPA